MKNWVIRTLRRWMREVDMGTVGTALVEQSAGAQPQQPHCRFGVLKVMNGRVLEVCTFKPNPHGPDWTTTYWILNEEQPLAEQLSVVMTMKGLEK